MHNFNVKSASEIGRVNKPNHDKADAFDVYVKTKANINKIQLLLELNADIW